MLSNISKLYNHYEVTDTLVTALLEIIDLTKHPLCMLGYLH